MDTILYFCFGRGFNDAINGYHDDGWSVLGCDGAEDVIVAVNSTKNLGTHVSAANALPVPGSILCAKASMLLQVNCQLLTIFTVASSFASTFLSPLYLRVKSHFQFLFHKEKSHKAPE